MSIYKVGEVVKMKSVLLVVPRLNIGGAESYVLTTAVGLQQRGYNVIVASWGGKLVEKLAAIGIVHYRVPIRLNAALVSWILQYIIKKHHVEIVHANSAAAGLAAVRVCKRLNIPLIYSAHGVLGHDPREHRLAQSDIIICVSRFLEQTCIERGFPSEKLITMYNGIDIEKFSPQKDQSINVREKLQIPKNAFVIGMVSRIKNLSDKGHGDMIQMLTQCDIPENWRVVVVGKGKGLDKLKNQVEQYGLKEKIIFTGQQTNVDEILQSIDVLVLPSQFETFGLVIGEAMAVGKPTVAYSVGGIPEAIEDGKTGFLVEKNNVVQLYEKVHWLYMHKQEAYEMGQEGRRRVQNMFNHTRMIDQLCHIYGGLINSYNKFKA